MVISRLDSSHRNAHGTHSRRSPTAGGRGSDAISSFDLGGVWGGDINSDKDSIRAAALLAEVKRRTRRHAERAVPLQPLAGLCERGDRVCRGHARGPDAYRGYYGWQVYYFTTRGDILLPVGTGTSDRIRSAARSRGGVTFGRRPRLLQAIFFIVLPMTVVPTRPTRLRSSGDPEHTTGGRTRTLAATDAFGSPPRRDHGMAGRISQWLWTDLMILCIFSGRPTNVRSPLFWRPSTDTFLSAVHRPDLAAPARTPFGFDYTENGLDVVARDTATWKWKDDEEAGRGCGARPLLPGRRTEAHAEGLQAVDRLRAERERFEKWIELASRSGWPSEIGEGWDRLP